MWKNTGTNATASGEFQDGDPSQGIPRSILGEAWLNMMQRELQNLVTGAGLTLNQANESQVLAAVQAIVSGAGAAFLAQAQNLADLEDAAAARANLGVYSQAEAIAASFGAGNQYVRFPGVLLRMGETTTQSGETVTGTVTFPTAPYQFSAAPRVFLSTQNSASGSIAIPELTSAPSAANFDWRMQDRDLSGSDFDAKLIWFAIGPTA